MTQNIKIHRENRFKIVFFSEWTANALLFSVESTIFFRISWNQLNLCNVLHWLGFVYAMHGIRLFFLHNTYQGRNFSVKKILNFVKAFRIRVSKCVWKCLCVPQKCYIKRNLTAMMPSARFKINKNWQIYESNLHREKRHHVKWIRFDLIAVSPLWC